MFGLGGAEVLIIIVIAVILFGAPVLTFLLGYTLGQRRASADDAAKPSTPDDTETSAHE